MVVLLVADIARSLAFYRRLGIEFADGADQRPGGNTVLVTAG